MLREIRVASKQELIDRIHQSFEEINAARSCFRWKYKMDETLLVELRREHLVGNLARQGWKSLDLTEGLTRYSFYTCEISPADSHTMVRAFHVAWIDKDLRRCWDCPLELSRNIEALEFLLKRHPGRTDEFARTVGDSSEFQLEKS